MDRHHGQKTRGLYTAPQSPFFEGRFGRMFRNLPVHEHDLKFLRDLADAMEEQDRSPAGDNPSIPAGFTYFGQFVDHDVTFDPTSSLQKQNDPDALVNFRSPRLDLDCIYGAGPDDQPYLYDQAQPGKFLIGRITDDDERAHVGPGAGDDLQRNRQGRAMIGDPRNDENTFVSQLQLAFLKLHNRLIELVAHEDGLEGGELFREAQRQARWHYQWVVVHDFLPRLVGAENLAGRLVTDPSGAERVELQLYKYRDHPYMPVEFSGAAYRYGHSQIRGFYAINELVKAPTFRPGPLADRTSDFRGFRSLPPFWTVQWPFFFELDGTAPQPTRKIDTKLSGALFSLPGEDEDDRDMKSLARRNLLRGRALGLPSGHRVANAMNVPKDRQLTRDQLGFKRPCPLWFYVLREAEALHGGTRLGPVGGGIVAETFLGLLDADRSSYLSVEPGWKPTLPAAEAGTFTMADLLRFAAPDQAVRVPVGQEAVAPAPTG
jgi:hypothetical protein